jgi:hypothetical protein
MKDDGLPKLDFKLGGRVSLVHRARDCFDASWLVAGRDS